MTAIVNQAHYNQLPGLAEAHDAREAAGIDQVINGPIRDVFLKHVAHLTHCLYLQHRHHHCEDNEAIVKVEGTAHLMDGAARDEIYSFGNSILPTTWMTNGGQVEPMEFAVVPNGTQIPGLSQEFVDEFLAVLAENNISGMFGIDTLAKESWAEMKIGEASVVVPSEGNAFDAEKFIPVAFAFEDAKPGFIVHGKCGKDHKHSSKPQRK